MASLLWGRHKSNQKAPSTIFSSNNNLSPRQVANKAYSLAIKKLDKDDKRHKPKYHVRERLLLCNTLSKAEQFLQKRTARTNRRVMSFEEEDGPITSNEDVASVNSINIANHQDNDDGSSLLSIQQQHHYDHQYHHVEYHSPLSHSDNDDDNNNININDGIDPFNYQLEQQQQQQQQELIFNINNNNNNTSSSMDLTMKSLAPMGDNAFVIPQDDEDYLQYPSFLIPNPSMVSPDCRSIGTQNHHISPIASI